MTPSYAQPNDLTAEPWSLTGIAPAEATRLLGYASRLVRSATAMAIYTADDVTGLPVDGELVDALRAATCAQVAVWRALNIDPAKGAADRTISSKSLGSASVTYGDNSSTSAARASASARICQDSILILQDAGLVGAGAVVWG
jgi:hypothetical protein